MSEMMFEALVLVAHAPVAVAALAPVAVAALAPLALEPPLHAEWCAAPGRCGPGCGAGKV